MVEERSDYMLAESKESLVSEILAYYTDKGCTIVPGQTEDHKTIYSVYYKDEIQLAFWLEDFKPFYKLTSLILSANVAEGKECQQ